MFKLIFLLVYSKTKMTINIVEKVKLLLHKPIKGDQQEVLEKWKDLNTDLYRSKTKKKLYGNRGTVGGKKLLSKKRRSSKKRRLSKKRSSKKLRLSKKRRSSKKLSKKIVK